MAPHAEFDTEQVKEKARKDLLYLLEGVCLIQKLPWTQQTPINPLPHPVFDTLKR